MKPIDGYNKLRGGYYTPIKYLNLLQNGQFEHQMIPS